MHVHVTITFSPIMSMPHAYNQYSLYMKYYRAASCCQAAAAALHCLLY